MKTLTQEQESLLGKTVRLRRALDAGLRIRLRRPWGKYDLYYRNKDGSYHMGNYSPEPVEDDFHLDYYVALEDFELENSKGAYVYADWDSAANERLGF